MFSACHFASAPPKFSICTFLHICKSQYFTFEFLIIKPLFGTFRANSAKSDNASDNVFMQSGWSHSTFRIARISGCNDRKCPLYSHASVTRISSPVLTKFPPRSFENPPMCAVNFLPEFFKIAAIKDVTVVLP